VNNLLPRVIRALTAVAGALAIVAGVAGPASVPMPFATDSEDQTPVTADAPLRVMPLGDSITYGSGSETTNSYRVDLYGRLTAAGLAVDFVGSVRSGPASAGADLDNEGHPGWRIGQIAEQVDGWLATYQPDVVLLHIGTNDMRSAERAAGATGRLSALIDQIAVARPAAHIFVSRIIGARDGDDLGADQRRINAYNATVPGVVAGKGPLVHLVDQRMVDETDLLDHLHPNDHGFAKMSYQWYRALQPVLNDTGQAWPAGENPFAVTRKYLRRQHADGSVDGRWWHRRPVTVRQDGVERQGMQWQTQRTVTESYPVWVPGRTERGVRTVYVKRHREYVDGRYVWVRGHKEQSTVEVTVPGHYESRTRTVRKWVAF
jgi:lysophospholipase L1-like esterase